MESVELGRSGIRTSVAGLGGGSSSRFGLKKGGSTRDAIALIRSAFDLGITLFDGAGETADVDAVLGEAVRPFRERVVLATKVHLGAEPPVAIASPLLHRATARLAAVTGSTCSPSTLRRRVERALRTLRTDRLDVLHLHAVLPSQYEAAARLAPTLRALKEDGKIRAIGITERFTRDAEHRMLAKALREPFADIVMVGFNLLDQQAAVSVLPAARRHGIGTLGMFTVRTFLRSEADLAAAIHAREAAGRLPRGSVTAPQVMALLREHGIDSLTDAAYRFSRHHEGIDAVLIGTGDPDHLRRNVEAVLAPPLPVAVTHAFARWFAGERAAG